MMEITTDKGKQIDIRIMSDWYNLASTPSTNTAGYNALVKKYEGTAGVYQVAKTEDIETIGKNIISEKIGYTGKSGDVFDRTGSIRSPKGTHGANRVIREKGWDKEKDIRIRYLFCADEDVTDLENYIHAESEKQFGGRFQWEQASAGTAGVLHEWLDTATLRLSAEEIAESLPKLRQILIDKRMVEINAEIDSLFERAVK